MREVQRDVRKLVAELPSNKVVVLNSKVQRVDEWTLWNTEPWMTIQIGREVDENIASSQGEFYSHIGDPEHGGGFARGTLAEVMSGLHPTIQAKYTALFNLENADKESIQGIGFQRYLIGMRPDRLVITADEVKQTGTISFRFMVDADRDGKFHPMPQSWGYFWRDGEGGYTFNVFEGGKGLFVGGGFTPHDSSSWEKEVVESIPPCTMLMDLGAFNFWKDLARRYDVAFRHHHFKGILSTS